MVGCEIRSNTLDVVCSFTNNLNITNDRILDQFTFQKRGQIQVLRVPGNTIHRRQDMPQIIWRP